MTSTAPYLESAITTTTTRILDITPKARVRELVSRFCIVRYVDESTGVEISRASQTAIPGAILLHLNEEQRFRARITHDVATGMIQNIEPITE